MDIDLNKLKLFNQCKRGTLNKDDLSKKGSIDEPILELVNLINENKYYYTTSTCSGRISLVEKPSKDAGSKKGNHFHLNSHYNVKLDHFKSVIVSFANSDQVVEQDGCSRYNCLWLKFEPFIMHIQCYDLDRAKSLLNLAIASGCRNSGVTFGKPDKYLLAIRSTSSMEVPIVCGDNFKLDDKYLEFLCDESNRRMMDNQTRLSKLQDAITAELSALAQ